MEAILYIKSCKVNGEEKAVLGKIPLSVFDAGENAECTSVVTVYNGGNVTTVNLQTLVDLLNFIKEQSALSYILIDEYELYLLKIAYLIYGSNDERIAAAIGTDDSFQTLKPHIDPNSIKEKWDASEIKVQLADGQEVNPVSLKEDQTVRLKSDQLVALKPNQKVDLNDGQFVNLNDDQKVSLKDDQYVNLNPHQCVDLNDTQTVRLTDDQTVKLASDQLVKLSPNQKVDLNSNQVVIVDPECSVHLDDKSQEVFLDNFKTFVNKEVLVDFTAILNSWSTNLKSIASDAVQAYTSDKLIQNDISNFQLELANFSEILISTADKIEEVADLYNSLREDYKTLIEADSKTADQNVLMSGANLGLNLVSALSGLFPSKKPVNKGGV